MKPEANSLSLDQKLGYLEADNLRLKQENTRLRKSLHENSRYSRRIQKAFEDALLMVFWRSLGIRPSRRFAAIYEIGQGRWEHALALIRMARLVDGKGRWIKADAEAMERKLAVARDKALEDAKLFFLRHTRHQ